MPEAKLCSKEGTPGQAWEEEAPKIMDTGIRVCLRVGKKDVGVMLCPVLSEVTDPRPGMRWS